MNKHITIISLLLMLSLIGCKEKNSGTDPNPSNYIKVELGVLEQEVGITGINYKLNGTIISPKRVNMTEHGFLVKNGAGSELIKLGKASKAGHMTGTYDAVLGTTLDTSMITVFIILETGDTITSRDSKFPSNPNPTPTGFPYFKMGGYFHYTDVNNGNEIFNDTIYNPDITRFNIVEYGIEYNDSSSFSLSGGNIEVSGITFSPFQNTQGFWIQGATATLYYGSQIYYPQTYGFRIYMDVMDNQNGGNITRVHGNPYYYAIPYFAL